MTDSTEILANDLADYDLNAGDFDWEEVGELFGEEINTQGKEDFRRIPYSNSRHVIAFTLLSPGTKNAKKKKAVKSLIPRNGKIPRHHAKPLKWFAFPSFDKSDSMIYFPCTFARLINSGDTPKLRSFLKLHTMKGCEVSLSRDEDFAISLARFSTMMETTDIAQPDIVVCMHTTKVEANSIRAVLYFKYTDAPEMYDYLDNFISDPLLKAIYTGKRKDVLTHNLQLKQLSMEKQEEIYSIIDLNEDLQVYGKMELELTVDDKTKKITKFQYIGRLNSICHNGTMYEAVCS